MGVTRGRRPGNVHGLMKHVNSQLRLSVSHHDHRDVVFSSTIERCGHEPIAKKYGVRFTLGKNSLDVVILQHLRQAIRTKQHNIVFLNREGANRWSRHSRNAQGTRQDMPFRMGFGRLGCEDAPLRYFSIKL